MRAYSGTAKGLHLENQDAFLVDPDQGLFAVADGVTIAAGNSKEASHHAISLLKQHASLRDAFPAINDALRKIGRTTLTAVRISGTTAEVGHVGDSVLYQVAGQVEKITEDDATAGNNKLIQAMGSDQVTPHYYTIQLSPGTVLVLATDGVAKHVTPGEILDAVQAPETAPQHLIDAALEKRKLFEDDKTVVVVVA